MQENKTLDSSKQGTGFLHTLTEEYRKLNHINPELYVSCGVKRGLRNADGTGVMAGLTQIGSVQGYYIEDGERVPAPGRLIYRGINVENLIEGFVAEDRFGFEETAFLLLLGRLPNKQELEEFTALLSELRPLPRMFTEDMILKAPSDNVMNKIARSVLALYSYDDAAEVMTLDNELRQAITLIARTPMIVAHAYAAKRCYFDGDSLYLHRAQDGLSTAENFLYAVRQDRQFTDSEAKLLDLCLVLHAEHGGGNNSAFTCRVISSSHTDFYSCISAAVGSLKGARHGGANIRAKQMIDVVRENVHDWKDDDEIQHVLDRILRRELGDGSGLIYGMGHAIYTLSDPRAVELRKFARKLAEEKGMTDQLDLVESIERLAPQVFHRATGSDKLLCANVDLYSGFVYEMLNIPEELYTPLFATARMVGWCAHHLEEVYSPGNKIIRPAYKAVSPKKTYVPLGER
jgi:citrate synthase